MGNVTREPLGTFPIQPKKLVDRVEVKRLTLPPGGKTGLHTHPGPTICYIVKGAVIVKVRGGEERRYGVGEAVREPGGQVMEKFDNASNEAPAVFIATYLLNDTDHDVIHMLEE